MIVFKLSQNLTQYKKNYKENQEVILQYPQTPDFPSM